MLIFEQELKNSNIKKGTVVFPRKQSLKPDTN